MWVQYRAENVFSSDEWGKPYRDGSVTKWLNQVTNFNVEVGALSNPVPAEKYFDTSLYLEVLASKKEGILHPLQSR